MNRIAAFTAVFLVSLATASVQAELRLPSIFGHHMVLQRNMENPVWGWADPNADVAVTFAGETRTAKADAKGNWKLKIKSMPGSPHAMNLVVTSGAESITLSNIVMGEVWVCSGQSNMQWAVGQSDDADLEIATANYPNIRLITVPQVGTQEIQDDFKGQWDICTPDTVGNFSAVGFFYGRMLHQMLGVPIGLIDNAWGGSAAEAWVKRDVLEKDPRFATVINDWKNTEKTYNWEATLADYQKKAEAAKAANKPAPRYPRNPLTGQHRPGNLWAGVLNPTIGYGIRGAIWYQGESNAGRAYQYDDLFGLMISEWRKAWGQGDFPFYWVQLADYKDEISEPGESDWAELREAQSNTLALPNTGQAVIYDIGEGRDIHPRDKQNVAKRLARIALARDYGVNVAYKSPTYKSMEVKGDKAVLTFDHVGSTLYTFDTKSATGFTVAGKDKVWHNATAKLLGRDKIEVSSPAVKDPVAVRYAWAANPVANVESREGLPLDPFRTDDWTLSTEPKPAAE
ncbi:sialate O-acetylesterase [Verrucomicrobiales bacterium BCK34]|nr:sialate O-acetylesterase [Verrucomicrobiales bacterium BCK34]